MEKLKALIKRMFGKKPDTGTQSRAAEILKGCIISNKINLDLLQKASKKAKHLSDKEVEQALLAFYLRETINLN
jgi:hypothetical protein